MREEGEDDHSNYSTSKCGVPWWPEGRGPREYHEGDGKQRHEQGEACEETQTAIAWISLLPRSERQGSHKSEGKYDECSAYDTRFHETALLRPDVQLNSAAVGPFALCLK